MYMYILAVKASICALDILAFKSGAYLVGLRYILPNTVHVYLEMIHLNNRPRYSCKLTRLNTVISRASIACEKASISTAHMLAFTGSACSVDYGILLFVF